MESSIVYLFIAIGLCFLIPYLIVKEIKSGKKKVEIFTSNILLIVIFLISILEGVKPVLSSQSMQTVSQILFILMILFVVIPLIVILLWNLKSDIKKWNNPEEYQYPWVYKWRYILFSGVLMLLIGALYKFYLIYNVLF